MKLSSKEDGIYIQIPQTSQMEISVVEEQLKSSNVAAYDASMVALALEKRDEWVRIADKQEGVKELGGDVPPPGGKKTAPAKAPSPEEPQEDREADCQVRVAEDGLSADVRMIPPMGNCPWPTEEFVRKELVQRGLVYGFDDAAIQDVINNRIERTWVTVMHGKPPINGKDAIIEYKVDLNVLKPRTMGDDKVDMKELNTVINVLKGQEIASKTAPILGEEGITVQGRPIKVYSGKDKNLPGGKGTTISEDRFHLYAEMDGHVQIRDGKLNVIAHFEVQGDVDYSIGNINFVGPVTINGSVREGFEVFAEGDLLINGVVEGATLTTHGDLSIKTGIRGTGKAKISCEKNLTVPFIDQAYVRAQGDIHVSEAIMHSDVGSSGTIEVSGSKKGQVVGGKVQAGKELICEVLGSEMGTKTEVSVGILPGVLEERKRLAENLKGLQERMEGIEANMGFLKALENKGSLDDEKRNMLVKLTKGKYQTQAQITTCQNRLNEIEKQVEQSKNTGRVRVKNICYAGVLIMLRGMTYIVREDQRFCSFVYDTVEGEIKVRGFDY